MRLSEDSVGQAMMAMGICSGLVGGVISMALVSNPYYAMIVVPFLWGALYALVAIFLRLMKSLVVRRWGGSAKGQQIWYRYIVPTMMYCGIVVGVTSLWVLSKELGTTKFPTGMVVLVGITVESILLTFYSVVLTRKK